MSETRVFESGLGRFRISFTRSAGPSITLSASVETNARSELDAVGCAMSAMQAQELGPLWRFHMVESSQCGAHKDNGYELHWCQREFGHEDEHDFSEGEESNGHREL